ncbi:MAG TPA: ATP-binding protein [Steroidobacteraceae bacterium]|nr:ATP-binding protein [Steroidobacteraceae bacterium]
MGEFRIQSGTDVVRLRRLIFALAAENGFSVLKQTKLVTAASELARNVVKYGGGGILRWEVMTSPVTLGLRLIFVDHGPGIDDLDLALTDGRSSGGGLGLGLPGARRLVDEFSIASTSGGGTRIEVVLWR